MERKEAIEIIRGARCTSPLRDALECLIPELAESEDERIRKFLIKLVNDGLTSFPDSLTRSDVLAYLEKQKDASKAIEAVERIDKYIDEHLANAHDMKDSNPDKKYYRGWDDALGKMSGILQDVYSDEKQKEPTFISDLPPDDKGEPGENGILEKQKDILSERAKNITINMLEDGIEGIQRELIEFLSNTINAPWVDVIKSADAYAQRIRSMVEKQKEKKPVDLSEMMVHKEPYIAPVPTPMVADEQRPAEWNEEDERIRKAILGFLNPDKGGTKYSLNAELVEWSDWLKSLPERFNLQPKNEWNEEDEKWINYFYSLLGLACEKDIHGLGQKAIDAKMWLKSLRPQLHWKPSEEQIKAIESCFCEFGEGCPDEDGLRSLYNDLKKLM